MLRIGITLSMLVAIDATECGKIARSDMAIRALCPFVLVSAGVYPEPPRVVIHRIGCPHTCAMAWCAVMAKQLRDMIRVRDTLKIRLMTLVTISIVQLVVAINVARLAGRSDVSTRQRKERRVMIERRRTPSCC